MRSRRLNSSLALADHVVIDINDAHDTERCGASIHDEVELVKVIANDLDRVELKGLRFVGNWAVLKIEVSPLSQFLGVFFHQCGDHIR